MPELPEVETITGLLREGRLDKPSLIGLRIENATILWQRTLEIPKPEEFISCIRGQRIKQIFRRGKFICFQLHQHVFLVHLRMSGDLWVEPETTLPAPHHRLLLHFNNGWRLAFNDPRKFGRAWLVTDDQTVLGKLGPEPLDGSFTETDFFQRLRASHRRLKPLLLDQNFIAGLGNIYTDEALHLARMHPLMISSDITENQAALLLSSIRQVLQEGIARQGASIDWVYRGGDFQNFFRVYQRTGQPCLVCSTPIERISVGQRSTHICPVCQKMRAA